MSWWPAARTGRTGSRTIQRRRREFVLHHTESAEERSFCSMKACLGTCLLLCEGVHHDAK